MLFGFIFGCPANLLLHQTRIQTLVETPWPQCSTLSLRNGCMAAFTFMWLRQRTRRVIFFFFFNIGQPIIVIHILRLSQHRLGLARCFIAAFRLCLCFMSLLCEVLVVLWKWSWNGWNVAKSVAVSHLHLDFVISDDLLGMESWLLAKFWRLLGCVIAFITRCYRKSIVMWCNWTCIWSSASWVIALSFLPWSCGRWWEATITRSFLVISGSSNHSGGQLLIILFNFFSSFLFFLLFLRDVKQVARCFFWIFKDVLDQMAVQYVTLFDG